MLKQSAKAGSSFEPWAHGLKRGKNILKLTELTLSMIYKMFSDDVVGNQGTGIQGHQGDVHDAAAQRVESDHQQQHEQQHSPDQLDLVVQDKD